jgi:hypothetical protein
VPQKIAPRPKEATRREALELAEAEADSLAMLNPAVDRSRDRREASETTRTFAKCYSNTAIKLGMTIVLACE